MRRWLTVVFVMGQGCGDDAGAGGTDGDSTGSETTLAASSESSGSSSDGSIADSSSAGESSTGDASTSEAGTSDASTSEASTGEASTGESSSGDASSSSTGESTAVPALRVTTLALRDPHVFLDGCAGGSDATNILNEGMTGQFDGDVSPTDGLYDRSWVFVLDPYDLTVGSEGTLSLQDAACTVVDPSCTPGPIVADADFTALDECLDPDPAELVYGAIASIDAPCVLAEETTMTVPTSFFDLELESVEIALRDPGDGSPSRGLLRGFVTLDQAEALVVPLAGTLAAALCASDQDDSELGPGWWFYFELEAEPSSFTP